MALAGLVFAMAPAASASSVSQDTGYAATVRALHDAATMSPTRPMRKGPAITASGSEGWTGFVDAADANVQLRYVVSNFTIPTVTCTSSSSKASFWVGLDGWTDDTLEQVGISTDCHLGQPAYEAWYEMYPRGTDYEFYVYPGDSIAMSVYYDYSTGVYSLSLDDKTQDLSFNQAAVCPSGSTCNNSSAEVILEANGGTNLSRFTPVTFTDSGVTSRDGTHGAFDTAYLWNLRDAIMTGSNGQPLAYLSGTSNSGENFSLTYNESS
jgi:Peptidase A4 family